jgi:hypothetical protein
VRAPLLVALACAVSAALASPTASADAPAQDDLVQAGRLYREGQAALDAGHVEQACRSFEQSLVHARRVDALVASAKCHELEGKTATAWAEHSEASVTAEREGDAATAASSREAAGRLAARLSKLQVDAPQTPGLIVRRDGVELAAGQLGVALAVDPGPHTITASAAGYVERTLTVKLGPDADRQTVVIPPLERATEKPPAPPADPVKPLVPAAPAPAAAGADGRQGTLDPLGVAAFVTTSVGAVGIAMGTLFGVITLGDVSAAQDDPSLCPDKRCTPKGREVIDEAETKATLSTVGFVAGGAALSAGVIMFVVIAMRDDAPDAVSPAKSAVLLAPGPGDVGAALSVSF